MFENYSVWDMLRKTDKPIYLYGTGNGGDKIITALEAHGASLTGVFASDGFVRDRSFRGYKVLSYADVLSRHGNDIVVLLAFGTTLQSVRDFIELLDMRHELIIPDVPLYGGDVFDYKYFEQNFERLQTAVSLFADDKSRSIFCDAVNFRLTGKLKYLDNTNDWQESIKELFGDVKISCVVDGGAFKGDSTNEFIKAFEPETVYAVEADPKTYMKLTAYAESVSFSEVIPINAALWDYDGTLDYVSSGSRGSGESGANRRAKQASIPCRTIDSILDCQNVDLIKLDIEGAEDAALDGAIKTIKRCQPNMIVSLYHRTDDIFKLTEHIHTMLPAHKLYLRRIPCIPMWDLNLYAVK